jgi:hypothetical protein
VKTAPVSVCNSSDRQHHHFDTGSKSFIFVRKTLLISMEGPAFFDEDDACSRKEELLCCLSELLPAS